MITIIKESFSLSLNRYTKVKEELEFSKEVEKEYISNGLAIEKAKTTKEKKQDLKKK
jgi:hypothetical protein